MIPIAKPCIFPEEYEAVRKVMESGFLVQGNGVEEFEKEFAGYIGTKHAVAVNSGTSALILILMAEGIGKGDEVIVPSFTFIASANAISFFGAKPVFCDVDDYYGMGPDSMGSKITKKTKAIMPVHLYGQPCEMGRIMEIAEEHSLLVIEDACQAHGAEYKGKKAGSLGSVGAFSFYATKNMTTLGEGGMVTTDDAELAEKLRLLRNQGMRARYEYLVRGYNFRMVEAQAACGLVQLKHLPKMVEKRIENAGFIDAKLNCVDTPQVRENSKHAFHQYTIRSKKRDSLQEHLTKEGVGSVIYYPSALHKEKIFDCKESLEQSERFAREVISIPVHPSLSEEDLEKVCGAVNSFK